MSTGSKKKPLLLTFAAKADPVLREVMPAIQDFNDPSLHETISNMCYSILPAQLAASGGAHKSAAGMAANQWGIRKRIFIFTPEGSEPGQRVEVMINPSYVPHLRPGETEPAMDAAYEGCFSVPLTAGLVRRYRCIRAAYYTPAGERIEGILEGWEARVFQHETDHLDGKLFDGKLDHHAGPDCTERYVFKDAKEMENFWNGTVKPSRDK